MELEPSIELLGRVPIFQGLSAAQLTRIAKHGQEVPFECGQTVLKAGDRGNAAYLILGGFVTPEEAFASWFPNEILGYGTFLGEMAMLVETTFTITIIARWDVRALALPRRTMYALMEDDPAIAHHFAGKMAARLQTLADDMRRAEERFGLIEASLDEAIDMVS
jgi:CRP/FNR family transcriptional regulator, cyclic AMP receptor protein